MSQPRCLDIPLSSPLAESNGEHIGGEYSAPEKIFNLKLFVEGGTERLPGKEVIVGLRRRCAKGLGTLLAAPTLRAVELVEVVAEVTG